MTTKIELVVEGVDLTDIHVLEIIGQHFADTAWATSGEVTTATLFSDEAAEMKAVRFAHELAIALPGAHVLRVHDDLVGASEVAARVGVSRQAVHAWVSGDRGEGDFPAPVGTISGGARPSRIWRWREVNKWMEARALDDGFVYPDEHVVARLNVELARPVPRSVRPLWTTATLASDERPAAGLRVNVAWGRGDREALGRPSWKDRIRKAEDETPVLAVESRRQLMTAV
jgi:predicted DNA-binding transcriptional regulator AlpA